MAKYRIETRERRWVQCTYEVPADDALTALGANDGTLPSSISYGDPEFASEEVEFLSMTLIEDTIDLRVGAVEEYAAIQARMARSKPVNTPIDNPEPKG